MAKKKVAGRPKAARRKSEKTIKADVVEARRLRIVDERGTERASLSASKDYCVLHMNDDKRRPVITLQVSNEGAFVCLFTQGNSPGVYLGLSYANGTGVTIADLEGKQRIFQGVPGPDSQNGPFHDQPNIVVIDLQGNQTWAARETPAPSAESPLKKKSARPPIRE